MRERETKIISTESQKIKPTEQTIEKTEVEGGKEIKEKRKTIERKFTVIKLPENLEEYPYKEIFIGYIVNEKDREVKLMVEDGKYFLIEKIGENEEKKEISEDEAMMLLPSVSKSNQIIRKTCYIVPYNNLEIEVDVYELSLSGLVTSKVKFKTEEESKNFKPPDWLKEVTGKEEYEEKNLVLFGVPKEEEENTKLGSERKKELSDMQRRIVEKAIGKIEKAEIKEIPLDEEYHYSFEKKTIVIKNTGKRIEKIEFYLKNKKNEIVINFQEFLPKGYKFTESSRWRYNPDYRVVSFEKGGLSRPEDILLLFHELGHLHTLSSIKPETLPYKYYSYPELVIPDLREIAGKILEAKKRGDKYLLKEAEEEWKETQGDEKLKILAKIERSAWAWALNKIREIKRTKNINLLKPFKDAKDIEKYIADCLGTYQENYRKICEAIGIKIEDLFIKGLRY